MLYWNAFYLSIIRTCPLLSVIYISIQFSYITLNLGEQCGPFLNYFNAVLQNPYSIRKDCRLTNSVFITLISSTRLESGTNFRVMFINSLCKLSKVICPPDSCGSGEAAELLHEGQRHMPLLSSPSLRKPLSEMPAHAKSKCCLHILQVAPSENL